MESMLLKAKTDSFFGVVSLLVHTLPSAMLESLDPCGIEALILVHEKLPLTPRLTGNASQLGAFSFSETENSLTELDSVNTEIGREEWIHSHAHQLVLVIFKYKNRLK